MFPRFATFALLIGSVLGRAGAVTADPETYQAAALQNAGDPVAGKTIFLDAQRTKCATCHQVDGQGGNVGPDLSKIGGKFDRIHLIESLLHPSAQIVEGYQPSQLLTVDGVTLSGVIKEETDTDFVLLDSSGKRTTMLREDIELIRAGTASIMPDGLADALSEEEFTDLIAYLETLRAGMETGFGAATKGPIRVADGFRIETIATGFDAAVAMETLPDGRVLVCEQPGTLRVIKDDQLLPTPMIEIDVESNWERGLIGVTVDPQFPAEPWLYLCYVIDRPHTHHVISRYRVDGDIADPASEQRLLEGDDQDQFGGFKKSGHQGGGIHFGQDGCLYIGLGEQTAKTPAQDLAALQGKILRINPDGSIPDDNPFVKQTEGKYQSIWALGCRNPFTFAFNASDGRMLINDVGGKFEEINPGRAGANYGWPAVNHGISGRDEFVDPIHVYPEASISGGDFAPASAHPSLQGRYVFADFVHGWVRSIDPDAPEMARPLVSGLRRPADLRFADDGSLYVLLRNAWILDDKLEGGTGSLVKISSAGAH